MGEHPICHLHIFQQKMAFPLINSFIIFMLLRDSQKSPHYIETIVRIIRILRII
jgi:hypothetical protein